jgi:hypothetical protein
LSLPAANKLSLFINEPPPTRWGIIGGIWRGFNPCYLFCVWRLFGGAFFLCWFGLAMLRRCFRNHASGALKALPCLGMKFNFLWIGFSMRIPEPSSFHQAVGRAIDAYSRVEAEEAFLIQAILRTDIKTAYLICFAVQNTRSRIELIENLLRYKFSNKFETYWDSCSKFIGILAKFRNAIAHWHPHLQIYSNQQETRYVQSLRSPVRSGLQPIREGDIPPFVEDCDNISSAIRDLSKFIAARRRSLPRRFQQPITCQNQAGIQPRRIAKAPRPPRKPSTPKLSRAQKRAKALKDARMAKKKS